MIDRELRRALLVDTDELDEVQRRDACRVILSVVGFNVAEFETDIPGVDRELWTVAERAAVTRLLEARTTKGQPRAQELEYAQTGVLKNTDADLWAAFRIMAPRSYDASVWAAGDGDPIVYLSDESQSIFARLTSRQQWLVEQSLGNTRLKPYQHG